ncbi:lipoprotein, partial [Borreliella japonica]
AAEAATGGADKSIGNVVKGNADAAKGGEAASVNGIAKGIKGIVDAAGQAGEEGKLEATAAAGGEGNKDAGKLFVKKTNAGDVGGDAKAAGKAAAAVAAVSGEQILKAIVEAAGGEAKTGAKAKDAKNPIDAAIGAAGNDDAAKAFEKNEMKKDDQIAAAMVLRGMAKDGQFVLKDANHADHKGTVKNAVEMTKAATDAAKAATGGAAESIGNVVKGNADAAKGGEAKSVNGIAKGIKGIVDAAGKAGEEGKLNATAAGDGNANAGKLFVKKADEGGDDKAAGKAAAAVAAVSGEQILKAIVDAAGKNGEKTGAKAEDAENPIDAAIGADDNEAKAFEKGMKKDDQIAAAMVLRGMAKDGQFVLKNGADDHKGTVKNAVEMTKAAADAATAATGSATESIGNVVKGAAAAKGGDATSVNGIAKGIKGIVDAAEKAGEEGKLNVAAATGEDNKDAGKLFVQKKDADVGGEAAGKAAAAVAAVSGEQILKAIVEAAGKDGEKEKKGAKAEDATNPIEAAIGADGNENAAAFGKMKKDDQIAAAMVLRGMAKDGQFVLKNDADLAAHKGTVKNAVEMTKAAKEAATAATGGTESIGDVVKDAAAAKGGDAASVNGIAKGIKGIVDAAGQAGEEGKLSAAAGSEGNKDAGKLFVQKAGDVGGGAADAGKAAAAVAAVSGEQILKAIVDAAGSEAKAGKKAGDATNPIEAAIGADGEDANAEAFEKNEMKKDDQIAAAMVLRGMAKDGQFVLKNGNDHDAHKGTVKNAVEMTKADTEAATAATGGDKSIGDVVKGDAAAAKGGEAASVNGIAKGIKGIVEAAEKAGDEGKLSADAAASGESNADAGKLFVQKNGAVGGDAKDAGKAAAAVAAVSGEQILKAIVDAAKDEKEKTGKKAEEATNPIDAAIGAEEDAAEAFDNEMKKDDQIAAAMVLRGMAKDGQFVLKDNDHDAHKGTVKNAVEMTKAATTAAEAATGGADNESIGNVVEGKDGAEAKGGDAESVNGIAKGIKGIVDAAKQAGDEGKLNVAAATGESNENAGKLFVMKEGADKGGGAEDAGKAAAAVAAVSGEQILKAIVDAAGKDGEKKGKKAGDATNPIEAAIGGDGGNEAAFENEMKKDDQIAAAMVLRGMAKDGQFVLKDANHAHDNHKGTVKNAVEMTKATKEAAKAATGGDNESIGNVVKGNAAAAKGGDAGSVNGIAKGIKGIVEAAEKAGEEGKLSVTAAASGESNEDAGKLFAKKANEGGEAADAGKAAAAVAAVSGEQILKAIVDAAAAAGEKKGAKAGEATNPIEAAIGAKEDDDAEAKAFGKDGMKKDDQIAAAMVLRGMAKDGQFVLKNDANAHDNHKGTVKNAVESAKAATDAAKAATGAESIGNVVKGKADAAAKGGEARSVNGIAKGIKGIVDAAKEAGEEGKLETTAATGKSNKDAGKLFVQKKNADVGGEAAGKAAAAVAAVSGEQILKAIVDAAGGEAKTGAKAKDAKNPIEAAIGKEDDNAAAFGKDGMKKDDQIAAAMVLRGMAKDGQFVLKDDAHAHEGTVKNAVEMTKAATTAAEAATGGTNESIGNVVEGKDDAAKGGDATSVNGIAKGIKGIVEAAEKAGDEGKLKTTAATGNSNANAGKLFVMKAGEGGGAADAGKAAAAVAAVSGEQILKAIVKAAGKNGEKTGAKAEDAENPIDAAIGADDNEAAAAFGKDEMKKDDQIAAAMVLRGMAKDGQFVLKNADHGDHKGTVKNAVESAKAATDAATAATGADKSIGNVVKGKADAAAKGGDAKSVNGIAKGIKGIVDAAEKAGDEGKLKATAATGKGNKDAGKLFVQKKDAVGVGGDAADAGKAAAAVAAVSGEQILKAIVDAAGKDGEKKTGKKAENATNPIDSAIGEKDDDEA